MLNVSTSDNALEIELRINTHKERKNENENCFDFAPNTEPVGSKAPTFSAESKSFTFVRPIGHSFALLCQAQAFPVPLIR